MEIFSLSLVMKSKLEALNRCSKSASNQKLVFCIYVSYFRGWNFNHDFLEMMIEYLFSRSHHTYEHHGTKPKQKFTSVLLHFPLARVHSLEMPTEIVTEWNFCSGNASEVVTLN